MKLLLKFLPFLLFAGWLKGYGQQNLFNIPSGDITPQGKFFFQHQTNFYSWKHLEAKNHLVYGLGKNREVGINVINLKMNWQHRYRQAEFLTTNTNDFYTPMKPIVQLTFQQLFVLSKQFKTSVGTQIGVNPLIVRTEPHLSHFSYNLLIYEPKKHVKFVAGPYVSDRRMLGAGNRLGIVAGFEVPLHRKFLLMGDFISGNNATAVSVVGVNYLVSKRVQLCLGGMLPNPNSNNKSGIVFELNLLGFNDD